MFTYVYLLQVVNISSFEYQKAKTLIEDWRKLTVNEERSLLVDIVTSEH